jgi:CheY-like chemotaxis protein
MKKILIVDDEVELCEMLKKCLDKTGLYEVRTTAFPQEVVSLCHQFHPDLILLDIVMPHLNGTELIKELKEAPVTRDILIVVTSGYGEMVYHEKKDKWQWEPNREIVHQRGEVTKEHHAEEAAKAYGVDDFIAKPFSRETLLAVLTDIFTRFDKASELKSKE